MHRHSGVTSLSPLLLILICRGCALGQTYTIQTLAGGGGLPPNIGPWDVAAVALDSQGNIFMALGEQNIVVRLDTRHGLTLVAGNGTAGYFGDGGPATSASLNGAVGIAVASNGDLYVADVLNNRIRKVSGGVMTTVAGNGIRGFSGDGSPAIDASLNLPTFVALDSAGNLYIADSGNARVREISNGVITTVVGNGVPGYAGDGGPATAAQLAVPTGLAVDSVGALYIADAGSHSVRMVSNGIITTVAGKGTPGYTGDNQRGPSSELNTPLGISLAQEMNSTSQTSGIIEFARSPTEPLQPLRGKGQDTAKSKSVTTALRQVLCSTALQTWRWMAMETSLLPTKTIFAYGRFQMELLRPLRHPLSRTSAATAARQLTL